MSGPAPSSENPSRRALRLAVGVTLTFVVAQLIGWPLAHPAPVFTALLLQAAEPLSVRDGFATLGSILFYIVSGYLIAMFLLPYPAVMVLAVCLLLYRFFVTALTSQGNDLTFVGTLIGLVVIPVVVNMKPEAGIIASFGVLIDFTVAIFFAWVAFLLIPVPPLMPVADHHGHGAPESAEAATIAVTMTIVFAPYLVAFIVFGWTDIVTVIYATIFAMQLSSASSATAGWQSVTANLILGGVGMLLFYELLVMVPSLPFMIALAFIVFLFYGTRIFSGMPSAAAWATGFSGFLILAGGSLLADDVVAPMKIIDRVVHIGFSTLYVVFAYLVVDLVKSLILKLRQRSASKSDASAY